MLRLIDTSVWISVLGDHPVEPVKTSVAAYVTRHEAATCWPVAFELLRGVADSKRSESLHAYLESLHGLPVDWVAAARWAASPTIRSLRVKSMDLLIAHTALTHQAALVHADAGFDLLARSTPLQVESFVEVFRRRTPRAN